MRLVSYINEGRVLMRKASPPFMMIMALQYQARSPNTKGAFFWLSSKDEKRIETKDRRRGSWLKTAAPLGEKTTERE